MHIIRCGIFLRPNGWVRRNLLVVVLSPIFLWTRVILTRFRIIWAAFQG